MVRPLDGSGGRVYDLWNRISLMNSSGVGAVMVVAGVGYTWRSEKKSGMSLVGVQAEQLLMAKGC